LPDHKRGFGVPVLLLFNVDPAWTVRERTEVFDEIFRLGEAVRQVGHAVTLLPVTDENLPRRLTDFSPEDYVVFNWCESLPGVPHSEALVAEILESMNFVYTGSDAAVLALSEDKWRVKRFLRKAGIPTPRWHLYHSRKCGEWNCFPAIVKAACEHCSEGITPDSVVMNQEDLLERIGYVLDTYGQPALVEDFIDGREFHVSLWGNGHIDMLPPVEMDFSAFTEVHDRLCTYDAKFVPDSKHYKEIGTLLPAPLDAEAYQRLKEVAVAAFRAVGCRDYARLDIRLRDGEFHVLDVNPNADISADASMACAAEVAGYSYGQMGSRLVRLAAQRHPLFGATEANCHTLSLTGS
jgi:D-alanine-D-alanine ligase